MRALRCFVAALLLCGVSVSMAGVLLQPTPAPEWEISRWLRDDPGSLLDQRGQVVLIQFLRTCDGCDEFSVSLLRRWSKLYDEQEDLRIVSILLPSGDGPEEDPSTLEDLLRALGPRHVVGLDTIDARDRSATTLRRFEAGGAPHLAIVDREGRLRFSHSGPFEPGPTEAFIGRLLGEPSGGMVSGQGELSVARTPSRSEPYTFRIDGVTGACAPYIPRLQTPAEIRVRPRSIDLEFEQPFLGLHELSVDYDADSGRLEGEIEPPPSPTGGIALNSTLLLEGKRDAESSPAKIELELAFPGGGCTIRCKADPVEPPPES